MTDNHLLEKRSEEIRFLKKNIKILGLAIGIMILIFLFVIAFLFLGLNQAKQCMGNPFTYGAKNIVNDDTGSLYCVCNFESPDYAPFYFNNATIDTLDAYDTFTDYDNIK